MYIKKKYATTFKHRNKPFKSYFIEYEARGSTQEISLTKFLVSQYSGFKLLIFYFICMGVLIAYMSVYHVYT